MSVHPVLTFKAGICDLDESTLRVTPRSTPGYIYLYSEDGLMHFCWRPRSAPPDRPELDLFMLPTDGSFKPYTTKTTSGRIYVLKFSSSSSRHLFWLQSRSQHPNQSPSWFSARDLKLGEIVDNLLQGEDVDIPQAIADLPTDENPDADDDETMEDVEGEGHVDDHHRSGSGGAGPDATGGDVREEGQEAREGGADGGRAATEMDANAIIRNFMRSMPGTQAQAAPQERLFTTLADLLPATSTVPWLENLPEATVNQLLEFLPTELVALAQEADDDGGQASMDNNSPGSVPQSLTIAAKKDIVRRVLRSPQFSQSLASLTVALRDGGLPSISEALQIPVRNGGYMRRGGVPLGGGEAVEAFLEGVRDNIRTPRPGNDDDMETL